MIQENIRKLVVYGQKTGLVPDEDKIYVTNQLLELFKLDELEEISEEKEAEIEKTNVEDLENILADMTDYAYENGILTENSVVYRDLFDTKIMNILMPRPSEVIRTFQDYYKQDSRKAR